jgi:hypothetical protein
MTERPDEFQVNPEWPLWNDLFCFFAPQSSVMKLYGQVDAPLLRDSAAAADVKGVRWVPEAGRLFLDLNNSAHVNRLQTEQAYTWNTDQPYTLMSWVKVSDAVRPNSWGTGILNMYNASGAGVVLWIEQGNAANSPRLSTRIQGSSIDLGINQASRLQNWSTNHVAFVYRNTKTASGFTAYLNGKEDMPPVSQSNYFVGDYAYTDRICVAGVNGSSNGIVANGWITDCMWFRRVLSPSEIEQLADPANVDLRIGNVPLILSPRRRFWPVVAQGAPSAGKVPWHLLVQSA